MKTVEEILALDDMHREVVKVPEWQDAEIPVGSMTARERAEIERLYSTKKAATDTAGFRVAVLSRSLKNGSGPWATEEQIGKLMDKNAAAVERLFEAACRVNGFSNADVETLEGN